MNPQTELPYKILWFVCKILNLFELLIFSGDINYSLMWNIPLVILNPKPLALWFASPLTVLADQLQHQDLQQWLQIWVSQSTTILRQIKDFIILMLVIILYLILYRHKC